MSAYLFHYHTLNFRENFLNIIHPNLLHQLRLLHPLPEFQINYHSLHRKV
jgi:hypothetical protein